MAEGTEDISQSDRLDILKTLLKEQIKANEILKYEFAQLNKLYQVVCAEKSLLVNELLDNHSTCSNAPCNSIPTSGPDIPCNDVVPNVFKRSNSVTPCHPNDLRSQVDSQTMVKRSRIETYTAKLSPHRDSPTSTGPTEPISSHEPDPWHQQDEFDEVMPSLTRPRGSAANSPPCTTSNIRNPNSRLQTLATQLNSFSSVVPNEPPKTWQHQFNNSCSPPALSSSTNVNQIQRPTKTASLVTSSSITTTGGSVPVVQRVGPSKYLSPTNRTSGLLSASTLPKTNLVINASLSGGSGATVGPNQKPLSQGAPAYRLSCSSTGQRILIQPSEHGRQIRIQQPESRITNLADESH